MILLTYAWQDVLLPFPTVEPCQVVASQVTKAADNNTQLK